MCNLKEMTEHQLWQRLKDLEDEQVHLKMEIAARYKDKHPSLFEAVRDATREVLNTPSMMGRSKFTAKL